MAINVMSPQARGRVETKEFFGQTVFSNGMPNTSRPDAFGSVYVFNDDILYPKSFLGMHPHKNVEIATIMISGTESHKDTLGVHENYSNGDVQLISSGKGVYHEGGNVSDWEDARHLQIWMAPKELNLDPRIQIKKADTTQTGLALMISPNASHQSLKINQDVWIYKGNFMNKEEINYQVKSLGNGVMIYLIKGMLEINSTIAEEGTTVFITNENLIELKSNNGHSNFVLIDTIM
jgi:quercetin 2,3-dioxygenase